MSIIQIANPKENNFAQWIKAYNKAGFSIRGDASAPAKEYLAASMKADVPLTYSTSTTWFDPVYMGQITLEGLTRSKTVFSAITKTSYQQLGDSYQYISTDSNTGAAPILEADALFANTSVPALADMDSIYPAIFKYDWTNTAVAEALSGIQRSRATPNLTQIRDYVTTRFWDLVEQQICGTYVSATVHGVDSPATTGSIAEFECLDRAISNATESGATNHVSAADDGDIFWNSTGIAGTARWDRSAGTFNSQVTLPSSAGTEQAYNIRDELDDLMAKALVYCPDDTPNYVAFMSPKAYNKLKSEEDIKSYVTDMNTGATQTVNGVTTTPGGLGGKRLISAIQLSNITVPIVTANYLMGTSGSSWLWKNSKYTTGGPGNIYLVNMNALEFRMLIPPTYRSVQAESALETKNTLYMAGQLIVKNAPSHAKLAYIAT
jgi:hypothetical protein